MGWNCFRPSIYARYFQCLNCEKWTGGQKQEVSGGDQELGRITMEGTGELEGCNPQPPSIRSLDIFLEEECQIEQQKLWASPLKQIVGGVFHSIFF